MLPRAGHEPYLRHTLTSVTFSWLLVCCCPRSWQSFVVCNLPTRQPFHRCGDSRRHISSFKHNRTFSSFPYWSRSFEAAHTQDGYDMNEGHKFRRVDMCCFQLVASHTFSIPKHPNVGILFSGSSCVAAHVPNSCS